MKRAGLWLVGVATLVGCFRSKTPPVQKPRGFPRVALPAKSYVPLLMDCPFTFMIPVYAEVAPYRDSKKKCWFNLKFKPFKATLHFTYAHIGRHLSSFTEDSRTLAYKHLTRSIGIREEKIIDPVNRVYGIIYYIDGDVASTCQFHFTDSVKHFLRGSFYFDIHTEPDSVAPVREFLHQDVAVIAQTLRWK
ncbi:MAG: hypothetical protein N2110_04750 [Flavobacteriales bacterium]|nr:hypothetical protein [Flavobacteriales bacterium]MCX7768318.1 hypothetical protein [Flavobacteriales bacterium]MDW8409946.1 hypothetical protein [Flavobacteriales bacterium]